MNDSILLAFFFFFSFVSHAKAQTRYFPCILSCKFEFLSAVSFFQSSLRRRSTRSRHRNFDERKQFDFWWSVSVIGMGSKADIDIETSPLPKEKPRYRNTTRRKKRKERERERERKLVAKEEAEDDVENERKRDHWSDRTIDKGPG